MVEVRFACIPSVPGVRCVLDGVTKYSDSGGFASFFGISQGPHTYEIGAPEGWNFVSGQDVFGRPLYESGITIIEWYPVPGVPWPEDQPWMMLPTFEEEVVVVVDGEIFIVYYWIEGMTGWENLETYPTPAKVGDDIHLAVYWRNTGSAAAVGHIIAQLMSPALYPHLPDAVLNQDKSADPGNGWGVQFAPVTLNESGSWTFLGRLDLDGVEWVDYKQIPFAVEEIAVGIPTTLTLSAPDIAGIDEKFNVSGILYETESGIPIPAMPINHSYDGRSLGSSTTGVDGDYLKEVSIPESGTWTLISDFPGTEALQASRSQADTVIATTPIATALQIAGSIVTGLALFIYGTS